MAQLLAGTALNDPSPAAIQAALTELFLRRDGISQVALIGEDGEVLLLDGHGEVIAGDREVGRVEPRLGQILSIQLARAQRDWRE